MKLIAGMFGLMAVVPVIFAGNDGPIPLTLDKVFFQISAKLRPAWWFCWGSTGDNINAMRRKSIHSICSCTHQIPCRHPALAVYFRDQIPFDFVLINYSFLDHKNGFNVNFLEGQKFIHDLALMHPMQGTGFSYFRDTLLGLMPMIFFLKPGESLGLYVDSEKPHCRHDLGRSEGVWHRRRYSAENAG